MAGFDDIILEAQPYMATWPVEVTVGADWEILLGEFQDGSGTPIAWTAGYTGLCKVKNKPGGDTLATPAITFPSAGYVKATVANAATENVLPGEWTWEVEVTRTSDGKKAKLIGGGRSSFTVLAEVAD